MGDVCARISQTTNQRRDQKRLSSTIARSRGSHPRSQSVLDVAIRTRDPSLLGCRFEGFRSSAGRNARPITGQCQPESRSFPLEGSALCASLVVHTTSSLRVTTLPGTVLVRWLASRTLEHDRTRSCAPAVGRILSRLAMIVSNLGFTQRRIAGLGQISFPILCDARWWQRRPRRSVASATDSASIKRSIHPRVETAFVSPPHSSLQSTTVPPALVPHSLSSSFSYRLTFVHR
jgi:hypothetical protein